VADYTSGLRDGVKGLRIGVPREFFFDNVDQEVAAAVRKATGVLEGLGAAVREVSLPLIAETPPAVTAIMLPEALAYHRKWMEERPDDYGEDVRYRLELGATFLAVHHVQAQRLREMIVGRWRDEVFDRVDVLAMPATMAPAFPIERSDLSVTFSLIRNTNPLNLLGVPAISVPCGFTESGLPIGLQLAGRWWDEAAVLRAAFAYEQASDWRRRAPTL
jgi:aspartyl-tRNA(Asn)/glutamyl-tRNA(Gln) amidotransferase subunit A